MSDRGSEGLDFMVPSRGRMVGRNDPPYPNIPGSRSPCCFAQSTAIS
jgi:hypothetical protein